MPTGGGAVHSYIAIRDDAGRVVAEYHGFPFSRKNGSGTNDQRPFDWNDKLREADNPISITPFHDFRLEAQLVPGEWWPTGPGQRVRIADEEVFRGSRQHVQQIQAELDGAVADINRGDHDYGAAHFLSESRNSNSVYATLMGVADAKARTVGGDPIEIPERLLRDDVVFDKQSRSS